jgi:hypothetical protein
VNHFLPVQKLVTKVRAGSKVKKVYDDPKTPYQRVIDAVEVDPKAQRKLRARHTTLDVVKLKQQLDQLLNTLIPTKQW